MVNENIQVWNPKENLYVDCNILIGPPVENDGFYEVEVTLNGLCELNSPIVGVSALHALDLAHTLVCTLLDSYKEKGYEFFLNIPKSQEERDEMQYFYKRTD